MAEPPSKKEKKKKKKKKKKKNCRVCLGGGQITPKGRSGVASRQNWGGRPPPVAKPPHFFIIIIFLKILNNKFLLFLISWTSVSFVALGFLRRNSKHKLETLRSKID
jgi:hypothetical protein